jgi:hypothetical protein
VRPVLVRDATRPLQRSLGADCSLGYLTAQCINLSQLRSYHRADQSEGRAIRQLPATRNPYRVKHT